MIMQWKRKPYIIEAIQWTGSNALEMRNFGFEGYLAGLQVGAYVARDNEGLLIVHTKEWFEANFERHLVWDENI